MYGETKNVRIDYLDVIMSDNPKTCAWTWNKLTQKEKQLFKKIIYPLIRDCQLTDSEYEQEWDKAQDLYSNLLDLVGYQSLDWRENKTETVYKKEDELTVKLVVSKEQLKKLLQ